MRQRGVTRIFIVCTDGISRILSNVNPIMKIRYALRRWFSVRETSVLSVQQFRNRNNFYSFSSWRVRGFGGVEPEVFNCFQKHGTGKSTKFKTRSGSWSSKYYVGTATLERRICSRKPWSSTLRFYSNEKLIQKSLIGLNFLSTLKTPEIFNLWLA